MPHIRPLANKPLVEAILEMKWRIDPEKGDPHYPLLPGRLYEQFCKLYPFHEPLPTSVVPSHFGAHIVQHRFRVAEQRWPLIQVGPGVVTVNDTEAYGWPDFAARATALVDAVFRAYAAVGGIEVIDLALRYLDAIQFDYTRDDVTKFLASHLKTKVIMHDQLFIGVPIQPLPTALNFLTTYQTDNPKGTIGLRITTSRHKKSPALIMETTVRSQPPELPSLPQGFAGWLQAAHTLTDDWFFKLIEGELDRRFSGEQ